jgi:hypothetical protein
VQKEIFYREIKSELNIDTVQALALSLTVFETQFWEVLFGTLDDTFGVLFDGFEFKNLKELILVRNYEDLERRLHLTHVTNDAIKECVLECLGQWSRLLTISDIKIMQESALKALPRWDSHTGFEHVK